MKRILPALITAFFCATAFAQDYFANDNTTSNTSTSVWNPDQSQAQTTEFGVPQQVPRRNSFYFNAAVGFNMTRIDYDHRYYSQKLEYDGTGYGYAGELTIGMLIRGLVGIHGSFEIATIDGKYNIGEQYKKYLINNDIDAFVLLVGGGVTVFPFSRTNSEFWKDAYVSGKVFLGSIMMNDPFDGIVDARGNLRDSYKDNHFVIGMNFEVGKDWPISERTYMGIGIRWQLFEIESGYDTSDSRYNNNYEHQHWGNSLQVMLRINRK